MSKLLTFLLGVLALLILGYFCVYKHAPKIQSDLVNRTNQALTEEGSSFAAVNADGRDLVLTGVAPDQAAKERAGEIAKNIRGVLTVDNQITLASVSAAPEIEPAPATEPVVTAPPVEEPETYSGYVVQEPQPLDTQPAMTYPTSPSPYQTDINMQDGKLALRGHVADLSSKYWLVEKAKGLYGDDNVIDELSVAYGAPSGWHAAAGAAISYIGGLSGGKASLIDNELSLSGQAGNPRIADQTKSEVLSALGSGFTGNINITSDEPEPVPEYIVQEPQPLDTQPAASFDIPAQYMTQFNYADGKLTLSGSVPDQSAKMWVNQLAEKAVGAANVSDQLQIDYGAPQGWHAAASAALGELTLLEKGEAILKGQILSVSGEASSDAMKRQVEQTIERGVSVYRTDFAITYPEPVVSAAPTPPPPVSCQERFNSELAGNKILFNTDEAVIKPESYPLLARLIEVARDCPASAIEISGHTDDRGQQAYNQWLSESRAKAVVDYLKSRGVSNALTAVGYGELQPIASNDTDEGMAKNRRIEFNVKGN